MTICLRKHKKLQIGNLPGRSEKGRPLWPLSNEKEEGRLKTKRIPGIGLIPGIVLFCLSTSLIQAFFLLFFLPRHAGIQPTQNTQNLLAKARQFLGLFLGDVGHLPLLPCKLD